MLAFYTLHFYGWSELKKSRGSQHFASKPPKEGNFGRTKAEQWPRVRSLPRLSKRGKLATGIARASVVQIPCLFELTVASRGIARLRASA